MASAASGPLIVLVLLAMLAGRGLVHTAAPPDQHHHVLPPGHAHSPGHHYNQGYHAQGPGHHHAQGPSHHHAALGKPTEEVISFPGLVGKKCDEVKKDIHKMKGDKKYNVDIIHPGHEVKYQYKHDRVLVYCDAGRVSAFPSVPQVG